ncbi:MAG: flagellar basal body P-ring formation chaperone FlgA [Proteobacteria bacterium]|nr:flagellar basal body P-ring formation chaperone FlgA [Pseudomonadota bacterium]MBU4297940.1 flagellar basal body P-ring formation chaperone FlgA [Pseudomonadota bacterium]MCG2746047.1 flagellar basal body P-ring formation chaperone FlgA [Desulfobulbaceae bacterium]
MRHLQFLVIFFCLFLPQLTLQAGAGQDTVMTAEKVLAQGDLQEIFTKIIKENIPGHIEEFRINDFSSQPESLNVPEGKLTYHLINQILCASPGKKFISAVLAVDGKECGKVKMYGNLHFWGTVLLASHSLSRRTIISAEDIETDFRDISMLGDSLINNPGQAIGKQLYKSLRAGDIVFAHLLKNPPLVKRGDLVTIIAKSGGLQVSAPGEVKNAGAIGEIVRVKNLMSRRVLQARVVDEGVVEIDL